MRSSNWTPSIVPNYDEIVCLVIDGLGQLGQAYREADVDAARFDTVISTWTLCSIPVPIAALREISRVLRPSGTFHFLEHGLSQRPLVARVQHLWNPIQKVIACGCNVNRSIDELVAASGLVVTAFDRFDLEGELPIFGAMYRGTAVPPGR